MRSDRPTPDDIAAVLRDTDDRLLCVMLEMENSSLSDWALELGWDLHWVQESLKRLQHSSK